MSVDSSEILSLIKKLRAVGTIAQVCEVNESVAKLPNSVVETICAFSNAEGGTIILGLSEKNGFKPAEGFDAQKVLTAMTAAGALVTPACQMSPEIIPFEGAQIVVAQIPAISRTARPCFVTSKGPYMGAFIRTEEGNRRLTDYEVRRLFEQRSQTKYDLEPVMEAGMADLNDKTLNAIAERCRANTPRVFGTMPRDEILIRLGALVRADGELQPTLGGLLVASSFPQQFFPRLNVTFTVYPGLTKAQADSLSDCDRTFGGETRPPVQPIQPIYRSLVGAIPDMLHDAEVLLIENMRTGAQIDGTLRREVPEYPLDAFRKALINALQHRDYSPEGRATPVRVSLYSDRLEIVSPGGLYGVASVDAGPSLIASTRNVSLSRLLENTPYTDDLGRTGLVTENRGTGLSQIRMSLSRAHMPEPEISDCVSMFSITLTNRRATQSEHAPRRKTDLRAVILGGFKSRETLSLEEIAEISGASKRTVAIKVNALVKEGKLERMRPLKSPRQRFGLA